MTGPRKPAYLTDHPGVEEVLDAEAEGFAGYRWNVFLKEGWRFTRGRMAGTRQLNLKNRADFLKAGPERTEPA